jgi:hypothetical protein
MERTTAGALRGRLVVPRYTNQEGLVPSLIQMWRCPRENDGVDLVSPVVFPKLPDLLCCSCIAHCRDYETSVEVDAWRT